MKPSSLRIETFMTPAPHTIRADSTLPQARHVMRTHHVLHLPVMDGGDLVGVLSERDILWMESLRPDDVSLRVADAMTPFPYFVAPDVAVDKVAREMSSATFGSAIVMDNGQPVGVFMAQDALRLLGELLATGTVDEVIRAS